MGFRQGALQTMQSRSQDGIHQLRREERGASFWVVTHKLSGQGWGASVPKLCWTVMSARGGPAAEGLQGGVVTVSWVCLHINIKKGEGPK